MRVASTRNVASDGVHGDQLLACNDAVAQLGLEFLAVRLLSKGELGLE